MAVFAGCVPQDVKPSATMPAQTDAPSQSATPTPEPEESWPKEYGSIKTYYHLEDDTWMYDDVIYSDRIAIYDAWRDSTPDIVYILLTNDVNVDFDAARRNSGYSSNPDDYFDKNTAVIVDVIVSDWGMLPLEENAPEQQESQPPQDSTLYKGIYQYYKIKDTSFVEENSWMCNGIVYHQRFCIIGTTSNGTQTAFIVLTNVRDIGFDKIMKSMLSSSTKDWIDKNNAILVDWLAWKTEE